MKKIIMLLAFLGVIGFANAQKTEFLHKKPIKDKPIKKDKSDWKKDLKINDNIKLVRDETKHKKLDKLGWEHKQYQLYYHNIPIEYAIVKEHWFENEIQSITGKYYKNIDLNVHPSLTENAALDYAISYIDADKYTWDREQNNSNNNGKKGMPKGELVISKNYINKQDTALHIAYKFHITAIEPMSSGYIYVDAHSGEVVDNNTTIFHGTAETHYSGTQSVSNLQESGKYVLKDDTYGIETYDMNNHSISELVNSTATIDLFEDDNDIWLPGQPNELDIADDVALDAHWGMIQTYKYFKDIHGRESFDNKGGKIKNFVHWKTVNNADASWRDDNLPLQIPNSQWPDTNGEGWAFYGDGLEDDYARFNGPHVTIDFVGHEFTHGVVSHTSVFKYEGESAALNEGFADIFGACVENYAFGEDNGSKLLWHIGEELDPNAPQGEPSDGDYRSRGPGHRVMSNPLKSGQPAPDTYPPDGTQTQYNIDQWYRNYNSTAGSSFGHINNGVINHWFYLLCKGGSGEKIRYGNTYNYDVTGIGILKAEQIVYRALAYYMDATTDFKEARVHTIQAAIDLDPIGICSDDVLEVIKAWNAVNVPTTINSPEAQSVINCVTLNTIHGKDEDFEAYGIEGLRSNCAISTTKNAMVTFKSTDFIELEEGFSVETPFEAFIVDEANCGHGTAIRNYGGVQNYNESETEESTLPPTETISEIKLYPNPTSNEVNIEITNLKGDATIAIYSFSGALIHSQRVNNAKTTIDLSAYEAGMYLVNITTNTVNESIRVVKN